MPPVHRSVVYEWLRHDKKFPHVWCPGCGLGILLGSLLRALAVSGLDKNQVVLVSGIGCSGRLPVYVDVGSVHTTHGRALTFATGIKLAKPEMKVITVMGDGDATAIGGNHLIHAARRNLDITALIVNNQTYGMTGGQYSPTTPLGARATTAPYGHIEPAFDISALSATAGAAFVARSTVYHVTQLDQLLGQAVAKKGFSVVEVLSPCHTNFGRQNRLGSQVDMMKDFKARGVRMERWEKMDEAKRKGRFPLGVLVDRDLPIFSDHYRRICEEAAMLRFGRAPGGGKQEGCS
jgi:2-oxoglutarate ferredoxin oxidoreductase subunit beta